MKKRKEVIVIQRIVKSGHPFKRGSDTKTNRPIDRRSQYNLELVLERVNPCGGGLEYLHRSPASRKRRCERNPVPGGITGPPYWVGM
jgi:hypothetical protein